MKYKLSEISNYVTDKVDVEAISISQYISTENMLEGKKGIKKIEKMPNVKRVTAFKKKDILISNIRPYFKKIWFAEFDGGCSSDVLVFRSKDIVTSEFLFTLLLQDTFFHQMVLTSKGTKMPRGDKKAIMNLEFYIPNISIQNKISQIIFNIKEKIELNNQMIDTLEETASTLFKRWFVDFELPDENGNPYKSSGGKMIDSELGEIPEGWEIFELGELFHCKSGFAFKSKDWTKQGVPVIKIKNIVPPSIKMNSDSFVEDTDLVYKANDFVVTGGEILIALTGATVTKFGTVPRNSYGIVNQRVGLFYDRNHIGWGFLYGLLNQKKIIETLIGLSHGSAQANLSTKDINIIKVAFNFDYVKDNISVINNLHDKVALLLKQQDDLVVIRDTLITKLLSGEIKV